MYYAKMLKDITFGWDQNDNTYPVFQTHREYEPDRLVLGGEFVKGSDFDGHLSRKNPSKSPGIDVDVTYETEDLPYDEKPYVLSPVEGEVVFAGGSFGTVIIKDKSGFYHKILHSERKGPVYLAAPGMKVQVGDPIAVLGNVHPNRYIKDHPHHSVIDQNGKYRDPQQLLYDIETGEVFDYETERIGREIMESEWEPVERDTTDPLPDNIA